VSPFADGKDDGALRSIGEVSEALGIKQHVLRYWEQQFPMLKPLQRSGGRRYYRPKDVALVETIDRLVNREGYTIKGAKTAIRDGKAKGPVLAEQPGSAISVTTDGDIAEVALQLRTIRSRLAAALEG